MSRKKEMFRKEFNESAETAFYAAQKLGYEDITHYKRKADGSPEFDLGWCLALNHIHEQDIVEYNPLIEACEEAAAFIGSLGIAGGITTQEAWIQAAKVLERLNEVIELEKK